MTALVHESEAPELILSDLEDNGQVALGFSRPTDHRSCQLKGTFAGSRAWGRRVTRPGSRSVRWTASARERSLDGLVCR